VFEITTKSLKSKGKFGKCKYTQKVCICTRPGCCLPVEEKNSLFKQYYELATHESKTMCLFGLMDRNENVNRNSHRQEDIIILIEFKS